MTQEHPIPETAPPQDLRRPKVRLRMVVGAWEKHCVEVSYGQTLRLLTVRIDGRKVYRHWGCLPWATRRAAEFKNPGREAHTFIVEPPGAPANRSRDPGAYVLWLDGQVLLRVEHR
jgi:hypothetical protein